MPGKCPLTANSKNQLEPLWAYSSLRQRHPHQQRLTDRVGQMGVNFTNLWNRTSNVHCQCPTLYRLNYLASLMVIEGLLRFASKLSRMEKTAHNKKKQTVKSRCKKKQTFTARSDDGKILSSCLPLFKPKRRREFSKVELNSLGKVYSISF